MRVLAFDTSAEEVGVALWDTTENAGWHAQRPRTTRSDELMPLVAEGCEKLAWPPHAIEGVVCGAGPGSFTGLRIGVATAKGLCVALNIPLVLVSSFDAWARQAPADRYVLVCVCANQTAVYAQLYRPRDAQALQSSEEAVLATIPRLLQPTVWGLAELVAAFQSSSTERVLLGDAARRHPVLQALGVQQSSVAPLPLDMLAVGLPRLLAGDTDDIEQAVPQYVLSPTVEQTRVS